MKDDEKKYNSDYDWNYDPKTYIRDNYKLLIPEDHQLSHAAISALKDRSAGKLGTLRKGLHIGIGAVPRGSALIAPFMDSPENGAQIIMGDIGKIKLDTTRQLMTKLREGKLGLWQSHEDDMVEADRLWKGSFQKSAHISKVVELDMKLLEENAYDIATAEHVFESATKDPEEYAQSLRRYFRSVRSGGIVHLAYIVGSEGYTASGIEYPAYPVMPDEVLHHAQKELTNITNFFTSASGQMREEGDTHNYTGLGVLVGVRK